MTHQALSETPDFRVLFESAPALLMVLAPDSHFTILAATDAYLRATLTRRDEVVGRALFEVFPDNIEDADANGTAGLRASLERVLRDGVSDTMSAQKHDMRQSQDEGGGIEERCWAPTNTPVLAADGTCRYIIHRAEDVAGFLRSQNERLKLLQQITRAIGERQDLPSICQVVIRTIEDRMPLDFACIGQYVPAENILLVSSVGLKGDGLAHELTQADQSLISLAGDDLARCVKGHMVRESDIAGARSGFARRLSEAGLRAMVAVPLRLESQTFGVMIAARRAPGSFSSEECEFLAQLAEHVALAANDTQLYDALHAAYEDLHTTQQAAMQQERLRALGQMASGIAHDINNSITPAALYVDTLLEKSGSLPDEAVDRLKTVQRAVHDVAATVARMREFYRPRESPQAFAPVQLNELVRHVVDLTRARWSDIPLQRGIAIDLRTELSSRLPPVLGIDHELREALINLVFNAIDAMPHGGTLIVRTLSEEGGRVALQVSDTGIGMDDEARRRCLEPFFTTKGERGTGLGLAMVYGVAQRHAADISIDSAVGAGTTITLDFAAAPEASAPQQQPFAALHEPRHILIVDDDPLLLRSLHDALALDGHAVVMANGGEEGIVLFREALAGVRPFDVVFTDLGMPYVDGRQVAAAVKSLSPATPVVMLTGWGQRMHDDGESPPNVDLLMGKPPRLRDLRSALTSLCVRARQA